MSAGSFGKVLYACPVNRLGNCFRLLASCWIAARQDSRVLKVFLGKTGHYGTEDFASLFDGDNEFEFVDSLPSDCLEIGARAEPGFQEYEVFNENSCATFWPYFTTTAVDVEGSLNLRRFSDVRELAITTIYAFKPSEMTVDAFVREKFEFYRRLPWNPAIRAALEEPVGDLVGVHLRLTDNLNDQAKRKSGQLPSLEAFAKKMESYPASTRFLLCTDSGVAKSALFARFAGRLATVIPKLPEVQQAAYEMLLLSRTREIIGSVGSTFSYEALFMGLGQTSMQIQEAGEWRTYTF